MAIHVVAKKRLRDFWKIYPQAERPLSEWYKVVTKATWTGPSDVKTMFGTTVDFVGDNRIIFDIGGNKYRLVVHAAYPFKRVLIKFVGTHAEYNSINPETV
jgi:mRNA interferase HigB